MTTARFVGTREQLNEKIRLFAAILSGDAPDDHNIARGFLSAIGFSFLANVREAYITKARGGTDEMGITWPPLAPSTIANRKVGPRDLKPGKGAVSQAMADAIKERQKIVKREEKKAFKRLIISMSAEQAKARARQIASAKATWITGKTKIETLGARNVEILRDTDALFLSLSPGVLTPDGYEKPFGEGGEAQIFEINEGVVIVGTNDKKASTHQNGPVVTSHNERSCRRMSRKFHKPGSKTWRMLENKQHRTDSLCC